MKVNVDTMVMGQGEGYFLMHHPVILGVKQNQWLALIYFRNLGLNFSLLLYLLIKISTRGWEIEGKKIV